jgi:hypothetical protein
MLIHLPWPAGAVIRNVEPDWTAHTLGMGT